MRRPTLAEGAWLGLAVYVTAVDVAAIRRDCDTMSACWARWVKTPTGKAACTAAYTLIGLHLFAGVPLPGQNVVVKRAKKCKT